jgi:hypothetical protein
MERKYFSLCRTRDLSHPTAQLCCVLQEQPKILLKRKVKLAMGSEICILSTFHMPQNIFLMFYNQVKIENPLL